GFTRAPRIWPPSKPIEIFWAFSSAMLVNRLDDLREDAAGGARMKKGYLGAADTDSRPLVGQANARGAERLERLLHRRHPVGDVVQAGSAAGQELAHRGLGPEWLEQLDVRVADVEQRGVDPLFLDRLSVHERHPEGLAVHGKRGVDRFDGHADVIDRRQLH